MTKTTPPDKNFSKRYLHDELTNFENALDAVIKEGNRDKIIQVSVVVARLRQLEANINTELRNIFATVVQDQKQPEKK